MRNVLFACALVLGTSAGCSSPYTAGEYAAVGHRAPAPTTAALARSRGRLHAAPAAMGAHGPRRRRVTDAPGRAPPAAP